MSTDTERCEDEVNEIRERMAMRIDTLANEFAPQSLLAWASGNPEAGLAEALDLTAETIRRNPISVALIGAGIAGIIGSRAADRARIQPAGDRDDPVGMEGVDAGGRKYAASGTIHQTLNEKLTERTTMMTDIAKTKADTLKKQASEFLSDATETVQETAASVKNAAVESADGAREKLKRTADDLGRRGEAAGQAAIRKTDETKNWIKENPVATGLMVMAAGAAIGSVLTARRTNNPGVGDESAHDTADAASAGLHEAAAEKGAGKDGLKGADRFDQLADKADADRPAKKVAQRATAARAAMAPEPVKPETARSAPAGSRNGPLPESKTSIGSAQS